MADYITKKQVSVQCDSTGLSSLVQTIANLICTNSGLQIIDTIQYGSDEFENYPIYNTSPTGTSSTYFKYSKAYQSDIYILGTSEDNYCLTVNVYNGNLLFGFGCSKAYGDRYSESLKRLYPATTIIKHNPLSGVTRSNIHSTQNYAREWNSFVPLIKDASNIVNVTIASYKGENSQGIKIVSNGMESGWLLFSSNDEGEKLAILNYAIYTQKSNYNVIPISTSDFSSILFAPLVIPFDKVIPLYDKMFYQNFGSLSDNMIADNCEFVPDSWFDVTFVSNNTAYSSFCHVVIANTLNKYNSSGSYGGVSGNTLTGYTFSNASNNNVSWSNLKLDASVQSMRVSTPSNTSWNLPKLNQGQAYLRRLYAPNSNKKFNFYLWFSPVTSRPADNTFVKIAGEVYLLSTPGMIGYAIKV